MNDIYKAHVINKLILLLVYQIFIEIDSASPHQYFQFNEFAYIQQIYILCHFLNTISLVISKSRETHLAPKIQFVTRCESYQIIL